MSNSIIQLDGSRDGRAFITKGFGMAFVLITSLFFMWAIANNFNDILIKQFQKALDLTRMQSGLVQTAFYFGYFTMALPAGLVMHKVGYKNGILIGLLLYALGAMLFFPAAEVRTFAVFLGALFVIASGLAFLETAANPYITVMGDSARSAQRLNLAQSFNGFGGFLAPFIGGAVIFSGNEYSAADIASMSPDALDAYRISEALAVQTPYLTLAGIVLLLALLIYLVPFPKIDESGTRDAVTSTQKGESIFSFTHLRWAVIAQFFYVGAQVGIWSYFINFSQDLIGIPEKTAAHYLGTSLMLFMTGRFIGSALLSHISANKLLSLFAVIDVVLVATAIYGEGIVAVMALGVTSFFMSVMFPTIFALGVKGLGGHTKMGSSLLIMAIVGGAAFPPLMGYIADATANIQNAMIVPLVCFIVIFIFGWKGSRAGEGLPTDLMCTKVTVKP